MASPQLPALSGPGRFFWTGGERGELRVGWCERCGHHLHPSYELCPGCLSADLGDRRVSGEAVVVSFTENHQSWLPGHPPPYVIGIVALREDPAIRLTTNIVDCAPDQIRIGMAVRARFLQYEDVWLPVFAPADAAAAKIEEALPAAVVRPPGSPDKFEDKVAITGVGMSAIGRRLGRAPLRLTVDACRAAIEDAGLAIADIDGICAYPGSSGLPGISDGGVRALEQVLRIRPTWHCGAHELPGQTGSLIDGMLAVAAGLCRHVLCLTTFSESARPSISRSAAGRIEGELAWQLPYGAASPANWIALYASHYMARYGVTRESLGWIAIAARRHAQRNPLAIYRTPLHMDDYLQARMISSPFGLFDCDVPCDGSIAVIVSRRDAAPSLRQLPVYVEAVGTQITELQSWDLGTITHQANVFGPAAHLWSRTGLRPGDVDFACLYDGFTFNAISWLEALGFCPLGEASAFVEGGTRLDLGGDLPQRSPHRPRRTSGRTGQSGHPGS